MLPTIERRDGVEGREGKDFHADLPTAIYPPSSPSPPPLEGGGGGGSAVPQKEEEREGKEREKQTFETPSQP